ncbi:hypothetical protein FA13DRAFT_1737075 [Coprinellus micaceus]|uniref:Uncharacterized protein n=1 Tax=Coprinellus micaceus TaxID=71717 RepID=A0A4Y7SYC4_COPMI|nr:hypothetical protein FA13DRAFT_1737075 [Coprinellus micaceus]
MSGRQTRSKSSSPQGGDLISARRSARATVRVSPYPSPSSSRTSPSPSSLGLAENWAESPLTSPDSSPAAASKRGEKRRGGLRQVSSGLDSDGVHSDGSPSTASKAPSPEEEAGPSSTSLDPPRTSSATPSPSPPPSQAPSPVSSRFITRRVTRSCAGNVELDSLQDSLPSCSRRASPKSRNLDPPKDEPEPLEWTEEVEKVKAILPHLPSNPQPWRALDPGLMKYLMLCEEVRVEREGPKRQYSKLVKSPSPVITSLSPRLRRRYEATPVPISTH